MDELLAVGLVAPLQVQNVVLELGHGVVKVFWVLGRFYLGFLFQREAFLASLDVSGFDISELVEF